MQKTATMADLSAENSVVEKQSLSFDKFINDFKATLKRQFYTEKDINTFSVNRGLPDGVLPEIMAHNPLSISVPSQYGGRGNKVHENLALLSAASYESLPLSLTFGINSALFLQPVAKYGQDDAKEKVFERFMNNQNMGGLMITEPGFGSDALNMQTTFTEEENSFHLKGTKHWAGLTGMADFWLLTARKKAPHGGLMRDVDFFICDTSVPTQKIKVEEYFENLGLYQIPYGRNILDVNVPKSQRLIPHTTGVMMMLDLLHRSRLQFPGMGLGFIQRMLDEAIAHCKQRAVGGKSLFSYDQVQQRLAKLQANFTICSSFSFKSCQIASIKNDLTSKGLEANIIKTVTTDMMQESAQSLVTLVGAAAYKLNHIAGRGIVDSRPFQIFEGSNDILYVQIAESLVKGMKSAKEANLAIFAKTNELTQRAIERVKELIDFNLDNQVPQRKLVELGKLFSRVVSMDFVLEMGEKGFRSDLVESAVSMLKQEIAQMVTQYSYPQTALIVEGYQDSANWYTISEK